MHDVVICCVFPNFGAWGSVVVKELRYYSGGPGIDPRWCHRNFQWHTDHTMALGSTQPLEKMSTRNVRGGKGGRCLRLTTSPPSCTECHEIWEPKPPGTLWATPSLLRDSFTFTFTPKFYYASLFVNRNWKGKWNTRIKRRTSAYDMHTQSVLRILVGPAR